MRGDCLMNLGIFASNFCKDRNTWPLNWQIYDDYQHFPVECFRGSRYSSLKSSLPAAVVPLNECILDSIWEISHSPASHAMVESCSGIQKFILMCLSAASYQAKLENAGLLLGQSIIVVILLTRPQDQLIAQSLLCLRNALEALHAQEAGFLKKSYHIYCRSGTCHIKCLSDLEINIDRYLDEVSRVILDRDTTNKDKPWWLSMFYSTCIQSFVRKVLLQLPSYQPKACREHLHLPARVFLAISGKHDPLILKPIPASSLEECVPNEQDLASARRAVNVDEWGIKGFRNSGDYLRDILEDEGAPLLRPQDIFAEHGEGSQDKMEALEILPETTRATPSDAEDKSACRGDFVEYFIRQLSGLDDDE